MICPNCKTVNDSEYVFCVNCGVSVTQSNSSIEQNSIEMPNLPSSDTNQQQQFGTSNSVETSVLPLSQNNQSIPNFNPAMPGTGNFPATTKKRNWFLFLGLPLVILLIVGGGGFYLVYQQSLNTESLPKHFGLFSQNDDKTQLSEVKKLDVTNALEVKDKLLEDTDLPELQSKPSWILYAENNDVPLNDLKLVEIDSIKDDGSLNQVEFQAAPVEGKPEMKKIRVRQELATGKYAFAIFDGHLDDGKHRFWVFEIKSGTKSDNGELAKSTTVSIKPKEENSMLPNEVPPPPGASIAFVIQSNVVMRSGPSQASAKIGKFRRGQKVYVIEYSSNQESFKNLYSNFARVQTTTGRTGWIYAAFIRLA
jgi:hypothetical protein